MDWKGLVFVVLISGCVCAQELIVDDWSASINQGVDRIDFFSLKNTSIMQVYGISVSSKNTVIYVFDTEGNKIYDTSPSRTGSQESGSEENLMVAACELDGNGYLDMLLTTEIRASGVTKHVLYKVERIPEEGLDRLYNRRVWDVKDGGLITSLNIMKIMDNDTVNIVTSSVHEEIRVYNKDGEVVFNTSLTDSIWDVTPIRTGNQTTTQYLAAAYSGMSLLDYKGILLWKVLEGSRVRKSYAFDVNGDGKIEYLGVSNDTLYVFDSDSRLMWEYTTPRISDVEAITVFEDENKYLLVSSGDKIVFLGKDGSKMSEYDVGEEVITMRYIDQDGYKRLFVGTQDSLTSYRINEDPLKAEKAGEYYENAVKSLDEENFNMSLYFSTEAARIYQQIGYAQEESKSVELKEVSEKLFEADNLYQIAQAYYNNKSYQQSSTYAKQAIDLFKQVGYNRGVNKSESINVLGAEKADAAIKKAEDSRMADEYYSIAEASYINGSYRDSVEYAKKAMQLYEKWENAAGKQISEKLMQMSEDEIADATTTTTSPPTTTTTIRKSELNQDDLIMYGAIILSIIVLAAIIVPRIKRMG